MGDKPSKTDFGARERNDHTFLGKSDPAPQAGEMHLPTGKAFLPLGKIRCGHTGARGGDDWIARRLVRAGKELRTFGADDGEATRTPSAWMISLVSTLALGQILFFVWVTLSEHKWVIHSFLPSAEAKPS